MCVCVLIHIANPQLPELDRKGPDVHPVVGSDYFPRCPRQKYEQPNLLKTTPNNSGCVVGAGGYGR